MAGTKAGGLKARDKNLAKNPDFYKIIGAKGGNAGNTGGFASDTLCNCDIIRGEHYKRQCAGTLGGMKSRRGKSVK